MVVENEAVRERPLAEIELIHTSQATLVAEMAAEMTGSNEAVMAAAANEEIGADGMKTHDAEAEALTTTEIETEIGYANKGTEISIAGRSSCLSFSGSCR